LVSVVSKLIFTKNRYLFIVSYLVVGVNLILCLFYQKSVGSKPQVFVWLLGIVGTIFSKSKWFLAALRSFLNLVCSMQNLWSSMLTFVLFQPCMWF